MVINPINMKIKYLIYSLFLIVFTLSGCRFTFEESDYVGHYEGTYRLANFTPNEGDAVLDIISNGNNKFDIMFWTQTTDSVFFYNWLVDRYSGGMYGPSARIHKPGTSVYDYNEIFVSKVNHHATLYFTDVIEVDFSGDRVN